MLIIEELQEAAWSPGAPGAQWILLLWRVYKHQLWVITRRTEADSSCLESWKGSGGWFRGSWGRGARAVDARGRPWPMPGNEGGMGRHSQQGTNPVGHGKNSHGFSSSSPCCPSEQGLPKPARILAAWNLFRVLMVWDVVCSMWGENKRKLMFVIGDLVIPQHGKCWFWKGKQTERLNF